MAISSSGTPFRLNLTTDYGSGKNVEIQCRSVRQYHSIHLPNFLHLSVLYLSVVSMSDCRIHNNNQARLDQQQAERINMKLLLYKLQTHKTPTLNDEATTTCIYYRENSTN